MEDLGPPIHNSIVEIVADMFDFLQVCASSIVWGKNVSLKFPENVCNLICSKL